MGDGSFQGLEILDYRGSLGDVAERHAGQFGMAGEPQQGGDGTGFHFLWPFHWAGPIPGRTDII